MDRRSFIKKAGLAAGGAAATALAAPAIAQTQPKLNWRLTSGFPKTVLFYNPADVLAKAVSEMTDGNFTIQTFQNGEIIAQANIVDAIQQGTVEAAHTCSYYYFGKDPAFAFGTCVPYGLNPRQENALVLLRRRQRIAERVLRQVQHPSAARRQLRNPDGRLVAQRAKDGRRPEGRQVPRRRLRRRGARQARRGPAEHRRPATSTLRWKRARSTPPSGSARTTTRSSASTKSRRTTTTRVGGRARPAATSSSIPPRGRSCRRTIRRS